MKFESGSNKSSNTIRNNIWIRSSYIHQNVQINIKASQSKQETIKEKEKGNDGKMKYAYDGIIIGIVSAMTIGMIILSMMYLDVKTDLNISLKENRNYLQILLQYAPHNTELKKELNNTQWEINQLENNK